MPAPDYSEGVPRSVVEVRRALHGIGIASGHTSSCTVCPMAGINRDIGTRCTLEGCPGVFVPIIEDETPKGRELREAMSEISERCWSAGWLSDTEHFLRHLGPLQGP